MNRLKRLFLPLLLIMAMIFAFAGCDILLEEDEETSEAYGTLTVDKITDEEETQAESIETEEAGNTDAPESDETQVETSVSETTEEVTEPAETSAETSAAIDRDGSYTTAEDVALYIHTYGELPGNFITKNEARELGWSGGSVEVYAPGMCIGGDWYGNYEGNLPEVPGREYHECDINTLGASSRGAERLIYSSDGQIYYTDDHYETFTLLYGEE